MQDSQDPVLGWVRLRSENGPDLKLFRTRFDIMRNPRNGAEERMIVLTSTDSVNVVALTPEEKLVFVRQYRFGIGRDTLELPGGIVDSGEDALVAAQRELLEETGFTAECWHHLGKVASNPVFMDSYILHFFAEGALPTHDVRPDDGESIEIVEIPVPKVMEMWLQGSFEHPHTVSGLLNFFAQKGYLKP